MMDEDLDKEAFDRALKQLVDAAKRAADAMQKLQSAFVVVGYELREMIDTHPKNILRETSAKEIGEATVARAGTKKA